MDQIKKLSQQTLFAIKPRLLVRIYTIYYTHNTFFPSVDASAIEFCKSKGIRKR